MSSDSSSLNLVVGARDPVENVGKTGQIAGLPQIELGQRPLDFADAVDRRLGFLGQAEPLQQRHSPSSESTTTEFVFSCRNKSNGKSIRISGLTPGL